MEAARVCVQRRTGWVWANGSQGSSGFKFVSSFPSRPDMQTTKRPRRSLAAFSTLFFFFLSIFLFVFSRDPALSNFQSLPGEKGQEWKLENRSYSGMQTQLELSRRETTGNDVSAKVTTEQSSSLHLPRFVYAAAFPWQAD